MSVFKIRSKEIALDMPISDVASIIIDATSEQHPHIYAGTKSLKKQLQEIWIDKNIPDPKDLLTIEYTNCLSIHSIPQNTIINKKTTKRPNLLEEYLEIEAILKKEGLL